MMQNRKRKPLIKKTYDELTLGEKLRYWKRYQKGLVQFIETEKSTYRELEFIISEIRDVEKKIKSIKEMIQINREKSIFAEPIVSINQIY
jgi:hypothetical protein